jgi:S1-C subfamily serine protease
LLAAASLTACTSTKRPLEAAVKIEVQVEGSRFSASGSHLGDGRILTNKHVCDLFLPGFQGQIIDSDQKHYNVQAWVNSSVPEIDLCLITTNATKLPKVELDETSRSYNGQLVQVTGYPLGEYAKVQGYVLGSRIFLVGGGMDGEVSEFLTAMAMVTAGGVSGSGVINNEGKLIGVVNAGGGGLTLFVPLSTVREFLTDAVRYLEN